jgi:hypothetical protein
MEAPMTEREREIPVDVSAILSPVQMADLVATQIAGIVMQSADQIAIESGTSTELVVEALIKHLNLIMVDRLTRKK